jgi:large subunit ribosomal protein LP1
MSVSKAEHDELCCVYAALLLADENLEITAEKINKIVAVSGNQVDGYYPEFFERFLKTVNINTLLSSVGAGAPATGGAVAAKVEDKKDDNKDDKKDDKKDDNKDDNKDDDEYEKPNLLDRIFGFLK